MKFCGMKPEDFVSFFKVVTDNTYVSFLDISENFLGEEGAHSLLKALNVNKTLNHLIC